MPEYSFLVRVLGNSIPHLCWACADVSLRPELLSYDNNINNNNSTSVYHYISNKQTIQYVLHNHTQQHD